MSNLFSVIHVLTSEGVTNSEFDIFSTDFYSKNEEHKRATIIVYVIIT